MTLYPGTQQGEASHRKAQDTWLSLTWTCEHLTEEDFTSSGALSCPSINELFSVACSLRGE